MKNSEPRRSRSGRRWNAALGEAWLARGTSLALCVCVSPRRGRCGSPMRMVKFPACKWTRDCVVVSLFSLILLHAWQMRADAIRTRFSSSPTSSAARSGPADCGRRARGGAEAAAAGPHDRPGRDVGPLPAALSHGIGVQTQKPLAIVLIGRLADAHRRQPRAATTAPRARSPLARTARARRSHLIRTAARLLPLQWPTNSSADGSRVSVE